MAPPAVGGSRVRRDGDAATAAALIALDWGSSHLRAYRLDADGRVCAVRDSGDGASRVVGGTAGFANALAACAGDWLARDVPVLACGMVGSAHGWREAPYVACPVRLDALHRHLVSVDAGADRVVHLVPGLSDRDAEGLPDVMRGEETQLLGLLTREPALADAATVVLPGTHSKWVSVAGGRIERFQTHLTGELYALLRAHSVLGRLMAEEGDAPSAIGDAGAFERGVRASRASTALTRLLFSVRTLGLTGELAASQLADYLSGLLIGAELAAVLEGQRPGAGRVASAASGHGTRSAEVGPIVIVGEPALCGRYRRALALFGREVAVHAEPLAAIGLWRVARDAGWL